jgi:hypothetical protein
VGHGVVPQHDACGLQPFAAKPCEYWFGGPGGMGRKTQRVHKVHGVRFSRYFRTGDEDAQGAILAPYNLRHGRHARGRLQALLQFALGPRATQCAAD